MGDPALVTGPWRHPLDLTHMHPCSMTNGGKSTLTNRLHKALPNCCVIHQDDFFKVAALRRGDELERTQDRAFPLTCTSPKGSIPCAGEPC